jgi:hypothetical protein
VEKEEGGRRGGRREIGGEGGFQKSLGRSRDPSCIVGGGEAGR